MTADLEEENCFTTEIEDIIQFLSFNNKIVFKSQQIDDPELARSEKVQIARDVFLRNPQTFLHRFGIWLNETQLNVFARTIKNEECNNDEIQDMLQDFRRRLQSRKYNIKNRRYKAMQNLIIEGEYFSELEMMKRSPVLYQDLIGQYLSEDEIKERDSYDVKNTSFSGILMHTLEQKEKDEIFQQADAHIEIKTEPENVTNKDQIIPEEEDDDDDIKVKKLEPLNEEFEIPRAYRQQWGNFEDENIDCTTSCSTHKIKESFKPVLLKKSNDFITAGERDLLRQEFIDIMHEQFLAGDDTNFDYSLVDDNTQLDDLVQINQDKEDAYFDTSDDDQETENNLKAMITTETQCSTDSEDELDLYMRHLNQHHSLHC